MNLIMQYWWLWLLGLIIFGGLTMANALRNVKRVTRGTGNLFSGIGLMFVFSLLAWSFGILLLISIVTNTTQYIAKSLI